MRLTFTYLLVFLSVSVFLGQVKGNAFKTAQLKNQKVKEAYDAKWELLKSELQKSNINANDFDIYIRVFNADKLAEVWVRNKGELKYNLFKSFSLVTNTEEIISKNADTENQVSEGFYKIDLPSPKSNHNLSMTINYLIIGENNLKKGINTGLSIMLNNDNIVNEGFSLPNDKIQELYILCVEARSHNNPIYIDIYPTHLTDKKIKTLENNYPKSKLSVWKDMKPAYDYFEENKSLPGIAINKKGHYVLYESSEKSSY